MKSFLASLFILIATISFGQKSKIDVKKDVISVNGTPVFQLVNTPDLQGFFLKDLNDKKLAVFNMLTYYDRSRVNDANPKGSVSYFDVTFMNDAMDKCEMRVLGLRKNLAAYLLEYDVIKDGQLNPDGVQQFIKIHGTKFSDEKNRSTTIIINNQ